MRSPEGAEADMTEQQTGIPGLVAELAASHGAGRTLPADWRRRQLDALVSMLEDNEETFSAALKADLGKPAAEAWLTEISFVIGAARHASRYLRRWMRDRHVPTPALIKPARGRIRHEPLGTVLIIAPWNYPLQLCLAPLVTAISAGNCAVIKPSELAPATSSALGKLLPRYLDEACYRVVDGGVEAATELLGQPFDHIVFTGGERVARIVMSAAARQLTPVTLELGGKSPCIVLSDADLDTTARRIAWGKFTNAGQTCIAPDYVLCTPEIRERLVARMAHEIDTMFGPDPSLSADYGRIVNAAHFDRLAALLEGHEVAAGGVLDRESLYLAPTLLTGVAPDAPIMREEIFGPLLPVIEVADLEGAIRFVRERPKPLAAYLFSRSGTARGRMIDTISAGSVCINDVLVFMAVERLPFGGVGASGHGSYKGLEGFQRLSHAKAVLERGWRPDFRLRYAPFTASKMRWLRRLR